MKRRVYAVLTGFLCLAVVFSCVMPVAAQDTTQYKDSQQTFFDALKAEYDLVWSDEFDGDTLDKTKWRYSGSDTRRNGEAQVYCDTDEENNVYLQDGNCVIEARKEQRTAPSDGKVFEYTSGSIETSTIKHFKYGYYEIRAKLPRGKGTWPAIWMMGYDDSAGGVDNWPTSGEIDIMEATNRDGLSTWSTLHYEDLTGAHKATGAGTFENRKNEGTADWDPNYENYHTFGMLWTDQFIFMTVDDAILSVVDITTEEMSAFQDYDFFLILNLAMGGAAGGTIEIAETDDWHMYIDYVRVYQPSDPAAYDKIHIYEAEDCVSANEVYKVWSMSMPTVLLGKKNQVTELTIPNIPEGNYDVYMLGIQSAGEKNGNCRLLLNDVQAVTDMNMLNPLSRVKQGYFGTVQLDGTRNLNLKWIPQTETAKASVDKIILYDSTSQPDVVIDDSNNYPAETTTTTATTATTTTTTTAPPPVTSYVPGEGNYDYLSLFDASTALTVPGKSYQMKTPVIVDNPNPSQGHEKVLQVQRGGVYDGMTLNFTSIENLGSLLQDSLGIRIWVAADQGAVLENAMALSISLNEYEVLYGDVGGWGTFRRSITPAGAWYELYWTTQLYRANWYAANNRVTFSGTTQAPEITSEILSQVTSIHLSLQKDGNSSDQGKLPYYIDDLQIIYPPESKDAPTASFTGCDGTVSDITADESGNILLPEAEITGKRFIGWSDGKTVYPAGSEVQIHENTVFTAVGIGATTMDGAAVRLQTPTGLRFETRVDKADYDALTQLGVDVQTGTLIVPQDYLEDGTTLTLASLQKSGKLYLDIENSGWYNAATAQTDGYYQYFGTIANIKLTNYEREFVSAGYLRITYQNGDTEYFYCTDGTNTIRTVAAVAAAALADTQAGYTDAQKEILQGYILHRGDEE